MGNLISAIVPVLNGEKYLKDFNTSLLSNFKSVNFIFVCSKSTDNTESILSKLDSEFTNVNVLYIDVNVYEAMNIGIEHSVSKYLIFLGADDSLLEDNMNELLCMLETSSRSIILGKVKIENNHRKREIKPVIKKVPAVYHHQSILFKRDLLIDNNLRYDLDYKIHSDFDFIQRSILAMSDETVFISDLKFVLVRAGGMSSSGKNFRRSSVEIYKTLKKYNGLFRAETLLIFLRLLFYFIRRYK